MARDYNQTRVRPKREFQRQSQRGVIERRGVRKAREETAPKQGLSLGWVFVFLTLVAITTFSLTKLILTESSVQAPPIVTDKTAKSETKDTTKEDKTVNTATNLKNYLALPEPQSSENIISIEPIIKAQQADETIDYSFYNGLAKTEVIVDIDPFPIQLKDNYFIQVATFTKKSRALIEQRRLVEMGEKLKISKLTTSKGTYYRLRAGPFSDRLSLNKKRNEFRALNLDALLIRSKK